MIATLGASLIVPPVLLRWTEPRAAVEPTAVEPQQPARAAAKDMSPGFVGARDLEATNAIDGVLHHPSGDPHVVLIVRVEKSDVRWIFAFRRERGKGVASRSYAAP